MKKNSVSTITAKRKSNSVKSLFKDLDFFLRSYAKAVKALENEG